MSVWNVCVFLKGFGCLGFVFVLKQARGELSGVYLLLRNSFPHTWFLSDSREQVDQVVREKEKLRSDLEKAEKLKSLMASEVDDHHAAIERRNEYNLRYDWLGQDPPFPPPWPRAVGLSLPARLATPGRSDLGVAKPQGKQDSLDTFSSSFPCL